MRVTDPSGFMAATRLWDLAQPVGLDLETNGLPVWSPASRIVGLSLAGRTFARGVTGFYVPLAHQRGANADLTFVTSVILPFLLDMKVVPFYIQMEHQWLVRKFPAVRLSFVGDGYIAARLLQMEQCGLKDLTEAVLGRRPTHLADLLGEGIDFSVMDADDPRTAEYGAADAVNALELEAVLRERVIQYGLMPSYGLECDAAVLMAEQQAEGYPVDQAVVVREMTAETRRVEELAFEIHRDCGKPFLINSPQQLGKVMERFGIESPLLTEKGNPSWSLEALELVRDRHPVVAKIAEWKSAFNVTNSLRKCPEQVAEDGRMHPRWQSIGIHGSSRMYAEGPAIANLPKLVRKAFTAPLSHTWVGIEWLDAELRLAAALAHDSQLARFIDNAEGFPLDAAAKPWILTWFRGGGDAAYMAARRLLDAAHLASTFSDMFPETKALIDRTAETARLHGTVTSWLNRTKRLDVSGDTTESIAARACTDLLQQSVGSVLKMVLSLLAARHFLGLPSARWCQVIPVFESVFYCVPTRTLNDHLAMVVPTFEFDLGTVRLRARVSTGPTWGELTEVEVAGA